MHRKDYNKQIAKRQRVKRTTLVIGMDIGNEFNAVCLMNKEGEVLGKYSCIYNSRKGFNFFSVDSPLLPPFFLLINSGKAKTLSVLSSEPPPTIICSS